MWCKFQRQIRNSVITKHCGMKYDVVPRIENGMLRWFSHVEMRDVSDTTIHIFISNEIRVIWGKVDLGVPIRVRTYL